MRKKDDLIDIIEKERIYPVFQPIVSLETGEIHGYEALSRIIEPKRIQNPEELINVGLLSGKIWDVEKLCRKKILKQYSEFQEKEQLGRLFINVNPMIMMDESFKSNFTKKQLDKYDISPEKIVIEVTEKSSINNVKELVQTISHYKEEGYQIAIDDVGECYSGLNVVCNTNPHYLKIDMSLVRNIDSDYMKYSLVKGLVEIARNTSIRLLAEGIETKEELKCIMELGVDFGQGYFLGMPNRTLNPIDTKVLEIIEAFRNPDKEEKEGWDGKEYKIAQVAIDSHKALDSYGETYGDDKADAIIRCLFNIVRLQLTSSEAMHIIDLQRCVVVIEKARYNDFCESVVDLFQNDIVCFYDTKDLRQGYFERVSKKGRIKKVPLPQVKIEEVTFL